MHTLAAVRWALDNRRCTWRRGPPRRIVARFLLRYHVRQQRRCLDEAVGLVRGVLEQVAAPRCVIARGCVVGCGSACAKLGRHTGG